MLLSCGLVVALPVEAVTLREAVELGLAEHPAVRSAQAEVARAATEVDIARDGYYPSLEVSAGPENSMFGDVGYEITATQMLYDWGRVDSRVDSASAEQRRLAAEFKVTSEEAALDIVEVYLDVLAGERRVAAVRRHIERLEALDTLTRERDTSGYGDRGEAQRTALELARAREQLSIERGARRDAANQYRVLTGHLPGEQHEPQPEPLTSRLKAESVLEGAIADAPLYLQTLEEIRVASAELDETQAALLPQLNLEGSLNRREIGGDLETDSVVALRLRMDTLQGLSNFRRPEAARQRLEASRWNLRATRRDLRRQLETLIENEAVLAWREQALADQIANASEVAEVYDEQFTVGLREIIDLLSIQRDRFEAERELIDLRSERLRIQYRAAAQLGILGALLEGQAAEALAEEAS